MPHSLRARLSGLRYKKIISDKDYDRLCKALDNEKILDKIRAEIEKQIIPRSSYTDKQKKQVLAIIDKYRGEVDCRECKAEYECYYCKKYAESENKE